MPAHIWSRRELSDLLTAIYASKVATLALRAQNNEYADMALDPSYFRGCRAAAQSLLLALGLPLEVLNPALPEARRVETESGARRHHWWREDLEYLIAGIFRSALSAPSEDPARQEGYRRGFADFVEALLIAIGSPKDPHRWLEEAAAETSPGWTFLGEAPCLPDRVHYVGRAESEPDQATSQTAPLNAAPPPAAPPAPRPKAAAPRARRGKGRPGAGTARRSAPKSRSG